jgi:hypothetical protein
MTSSDRPPAQTVKKPYRCHPREDFEHHRHRASSPRSGKLEKPNRSSR